MPTRLWAILLLAPVTAVAGPLLDYIRDYDLNDYALGLSVPTSQNPYVGADNSISAYPYLTSFSHSSLTDSWLLIQSGNLGFRYVTDQDWEFGLIGRIQTLGWGVADNDDLLGLDAPRSTIELGPLIGWRALPVHVQFRSYWEVLDRHSGTISELEFRLPWEHHRGYIIPSVTVSRLSRDYSDYYFGVSRDDATALFPEYTPGSAINTSVDVTSGFELNPNWLLQTRIGVEFLDSAIEQSPLVDRKHLWSGSIGLAYNADIFESRDYFGPDREQNIEIRLGLFNSHADTNLILDATDAQPGDDLDLEDFLGVSDSETVGQIDAYYRVAFYHRFDLGYFELRRNASTTLQRDMWFGDEFYPEGSDIRISSESQLLRLGYSYSLMRDGQKELAVTAGLSYLKFDSEVRFDDSLQQPNRVRVDGVLPTFGVVGSAPLGDKWRLGADIDLFALTFDRYKGYMAYLSLDLERRFNENFGAGIGYNFYGMRLKSNGENLDGTLRVRYQGPKLYLSLKF